VKLDIRKYGHTSPKRDMVWGYCANGIIINNSIKQWLLSFICRHVVVRSHPVSNSSFDNQIKMTSC